jgi:osmoprotectant transport system substrate-binding protein
MKKRLLEILIIFAAVAVLLAGCSAEESGKQADEAGKNEQTKKEGPAVRVATYIDAEGELLGNIIMIMLQENGIQVVDKTKLGTPDVCRKALLQGEVDVLVAYTGSGLYWFNDNDLKTWKDPVKGYEKVKQLDKEKNDIYWLTPAPANNTYRICTTKELAEKYNLKDMSDFARYVNEGNPVKLICDQAWADDVEGLKSMERAYGFKLNKDQLITLSHGNTAEMLKALANGTNGVNFSECYTTDGQIDDLGFVVLDDPKNTQLAYLPAALVRGEIYKAYPEMEEILKPVFESLTDDVLRALNKQIAYEGKSGKDVAMSYLKEKGFIK